MFVQGARTCDQLWRPAHNKLREVRTFLCTTYRYRLRWQGLGRVERTDGDVVFVKISQRKLRGSSAGIHAWLFLQPAERALGKAKSKLSTRGKND